MEQQAGVTPVLSIIIVSYNVREELARCVDAVAPLCQDGAADLWIVDNASSDGSADCIADHWPHARLIRNPRNAGFAAAVNQGLAASNGTYALLLNPDVVVTPDTLPAMLTFMAEYPGCGIAAAQLLNADGSAQASVHAFPTPGRWIAESLFWNRMMRPVRRFDRPAPVDAVPGACLMARRRMIAEIGMLDERFFLYAEDVDWCLRARRAGWSVYLVPEALATHRLAQSSRDRPDAGFVWLYRSRDLYMRKHFSRWERMISHAGLFTGALMRVGLWGGYRLLAGDGSHRASEARKKFCQNREVVRWYIHGRPDPRDLASLTPINPEMTTRNLPG